MYQGYYNLASGMLTQSRNLNVISNNMVNIQTPGYKHDTMVTSTFQEEMIYRTGKYNKSNATPLATSARIKTASETYVNYDQGSFEETDGLYDFALAGKGFFCVDTPNGEQYTRNGTFAVDEEGYLVLPGGGRVLSEDNQPIQINDERFTVNADGMITLVYQPDEEEDGGEQPSEVLNYGTLKIVDFADYKQLKKEEGGLFSTNQEAVPTGDNTVLWKSLEKSNVDMIEEMTAMMSSQRALQSAAQVLKMYDQIMSKSATDIGRL